MLRKVVAKYQGMMFAFLWRSNRTLLVVGTKFLKINSCILCYDFKANKKNNAAASYKTGFRLSEMLDCCILMLLLLLLYLMHCDVSVTQLIY